MSVVSAQTDIIVVDSATTLLSLLDNLDDYEDDDWYESDGISARDYISWEKDIMKNGEYF